MRGFILLALMTIWLTVLPAGAQDAPPMPLSEIEGWPSEFDGRHPVGFPPGEGWRVISGDGKLVSSNCIGRFETPDCIVDTVMACGVWSWQDDVTEYDPYIEGLGYRLHPVCDTLRSTPGDPGVSVPFIVLIGPNPEHFIVYYRMTPFILTEETGTRHFARNPLSGEDCSPHFGECLGDTVLVIEWALCEPALASDKENYRPDNDYPPGTPVSRCLVRNSPVFVVTYQPPGQRDWMIRMVWAPTWAGRDEDPWPYLDEVFQGMR